MDKKRPEAPAPQERGEAVQANAARVLSRAALREALSGPVVAFFGNVHEKTQGSSPGNSDQNGQGFS